MFHHHVTGGLEKAHDFVTKNRFTDDEGWFREGFASKATDGFIPDTRLSLQPIFRAGGEIGGAVAGEAAKGAAEGAEAAFKNAFETAFSPDDSGGVPVLGFGALAALGIGAILIAREVS